MAFYQYRAADHGGKIVEGIMEADLEQSVVSRLHEMGCIPLRITMPREGSITAREGRAPLFKRSHVNQTQLLQFTQELGTLLGAGLPRARCTVSSMPMRQWPPRMKACASIGNE